MDDQQPALPSLELDQNDVFQSWETRTERLAWTLMTGFLVMALLGVFGSGPLSKQELCSRSLCVRYQKFLRYGNSVEIQFEVSSLAESSGSIDLYMDSHFLSQIRAEEQPTFRAKHRVGGEWHAFTFEQINGQEDTSLELIFEPQNVGPLEARIRLNNEELILKFFTYP